MWAFRHQYDTASNIGLIQCIQNNGQTLLESLMQLQPSDAVCTTT